MEASSAADNTSTEEKEVELLAVTRLNELNELAPKLSAEKGLGDIDFTRLSEEEVRTMLQLRAQEEEQVQAEGSTSGQAGRGGNKGGGGRTKKGGSGGGASAAARRELEGLAAASARYAQVAAPPGAAEAAEAAVAAGSVAEGVPVALGTAVSVRPPGPPVVADATTLAAYRSALAELEGGRAAGVPLEAALAAVRLRNAGLKLELARSKHEGLRRQEHKCVAEMEHVTGEKWHPSKVMAAIDSKKVNRRVARTISITARCRQAAREVRGLQLLVGEYEEALGALEERRARMEQAQAFCEQVTSDLFRGSGAGDARENELEADADALLPRLAELQRHRGAYEQARLMLGNTRSCLSKARKELRTATVLAHVDFWTDVVVLVLRVVLAVAGGEAGGAAPAGTGGPSVGSVVAIALVPDMPVASRQLAGLRTGGTLLAVFDLLDFSVGDLAVLLHVSKQYDVVKKKLKQVKNACAWIQGWIQRSEDDTRALEEVLAAKRGALFDYRLGLLKAWVEGAAAAPAVGTAAAAAQ
ncbi:hypothetical protein HYH03_008621 [Edaphochlamys debaryana]|uniref:Uncharacterized protein n=1 Tax=Edaphochlamys debaryana TaxID=47281 RepID=A0A835XZQ1_9CHLO|nr:hypothetical protein HYH03_008621 [Edaphochlamys debaryana]|eukprot:KAG2493201.1 hypothetical protein HYH03_008621 [Edaphochlamys debaryana]